MAALLREFLDLRDLIGRFDRAAGEQGDLGIDRGTLLIDDLLRGAGELEIDVESEVVNLGIEAPQCLLVGRQRRNAAPNGALLLNVATVVWAEQLEIAVAAAPIYDRRVFTLARPARPRQAQHRRIAFGVFAERKSERRSDALEAARQRAHLRGGLRAAPLIEPRLGPAVARRQDIVPDQPIEIRVEGADRPAVHDGANDQFRASRAGNPRFDRVVVFGETTA